MQLHRFTLAAIAAALALQAAPCQNHVSMAVTTSIGTVGNADEPFQCLPNQTLAVVGEVLRVDIWGNGGMPYILFTGLPSTYCQPFAGFAGEVAVSLPVYTFAIGGLVDAGGTAGLGTDVIRFPIAGYIPTGTQIRLQVLSVCDEGPGFGRATEVHVR